MKEISELVDAELMSEYRRLSQNLYGLSASGIERLQEVSTAIEKDYEIRHTPGDIQFVKRQ